MTIEARPARQALRGARPVRRLGAVLALTWAFALAGLAAAEDDPPGQAVFERVCASCHQASGEGIEGT